MPTRLLLLLCLTGHVFAREPPDVDCLVIHLKYVHCSWNKQTAPEVNYTFYGWFNLERSKDFECPTYLSENNTNTGCNLPYTNNQRFRIFNTKLVHGNQTYQREHNLKTKVKLNPPTDVTVRNESDSNLWLNWSQIKYTCVESEVRYRFNNRDWATYQVRIGEQKYCINLPSSISRYELQVRSRLGEVCGKSSFWSNWSEPVVWGSNNGLKGSFNYNERPCLVREYCHVSQSDSEDCSVFIPVNESDLSTSCSSSTSTVSTEEEMVSV